MMIVIMKISRTNFFAFILVVHQNFVQKHPHRRIKSLKSERERERERLHALLLLKEHVNSRVKSDEMKCLILTTSREKEQPKNR